MKKRASFVAMYLCLLLLLTCGAGELLLVDKAARPSETENRMLQGFPTLSAESLRSGSFMDEFEAFLSDGFFFREAAAAFSDWTLGLFTLPDKGPALGEIDQAQLYRVDEEEEARREEILQAAAAPPAEQEPVAALPAERPAAEARDASFWLVDSQGKQVVLDRYPAESLSGLAHILNLYRAELPEDGTLHFLSPPTSQVANNIIQGDYVDWDTDLMEAMQPLVDEGVYVYNATDILRPWLFDRLYPVIDHHWHPIGASRVADAMLAVQGVPAVPYESYRYGLSSKSGGPYDTDTLAGMKVGVGTVPVLEPISPVESYVIRKLDQRSPSDFIIRNAGSYLVYLGGTKSPWRLFITGFHTGRSALVIGDSFTNSFIPYLVPYYDQIISTDFRDGTYSLSEAGANAHQYIEYYGVDDIYILLSKLSMFTKASVQGRFEQYLNLDYGKVSG